MAIDPRGHTVPLGIDTPRRAWINDLSESISSVMPVATFEEGQTRLNEMEAAGIDTIGTVWFVQARGSLYVRLASGWARIVDESDDLLPVMAYGLAISITGAANAVRSRVITFPAGRFPETPIVMAQMGTGSTSATVNTEIWVSYRTATSFTLNINRSNNTTVSLTWMAVYYAGAPEVPDVPDGTFLRFAPFATDAAPADDDQEDQPREPGVALVTCRTEGCDNQGIPLEIHFDPNAERPQVDCGVCGQPITDIDDEKEAGT